MASRSKERTEYIGIRVTPDEKVLIKGFSEALNMSMTDFLLSCVGTTLRTAFRLSLLRLKAKKEEP